MYCTVVVLLLPRKTMDVHIFLKLLCIVTFKKKMTPHFSSLQRFIQSLAIFLLTVGFVTTSPGPPWKQHNHVQYGKVILPNYFKIRIKPKVETVWLFILQQLSTNTACSSTQYSRNATKLLSHDWKDGSANPVKLYWFCLVETADLLQKGLFQSVMVRL